MFKQRLLTTLILVPLVLLAIYYANHAALGGIVLLVVLLMGWEWLQLIPIKHVVNKGLFLVALLLLIWPAMHWLHYWVIADLLCWCAILMAVLMYPVSQAVWGHRFIVAGAGMLLLPLVASTICALYLQPQGQDLIVYLLCLIWATDIGAYLVGKQWGTHKLIVAVSPGKTIEGTVGGLALALLVACLGFVYFKPESILAWLTTAIATALISILGDLFISMLKRRCHLKDTGQIFPGHGGVLDRLDSLLAALPLFYFAQHFLMGVS